MLRLFASRSTPLRSRTTLTQYFHHTAILHSASSPASAEVEEAPPAEGPKSRGKGRLRATSKPKADEQLFIPKPTAPQTRKKLRTKASEDVVPEEKPPVVRIRRKSSEEVTPEEPDSNGDPVPRRRRSRAINASIKAVKEDGETPPLRSFPPKMDRRTLRNFGRTSPEKPEGNPRDDVAKYLQWGYGGQWKGGRAFGDNKRMNLVSMDACDDILERLGPSLEKFAGCDILDINPGAGVWSKALHDFLKPRTHILMEPDIAMYGPLLEPLVQAPGSKYVLVPKSGIVWGHLETTISEEYLPFQKQLKRGDPELEQPNNTLLVVANLGYNPRRPYRGFSSLAQMVIYQFMSAVKAHSLFQKYGLVRMLLWVSDEEKFHVLPKSVVYRRKAAIEADIASEKIVEVASSTHDPTRWPRERHIELMAARSVLEKMNKNSIRIPPGRESDMLQQLSQSSPGDSQIRELPTRLQGELETLEALAAKGELQKKENADALMKRMLDLRWQKVSFIKMKTRVFDLCDEHELILEETKACCNARDSAALRLRREKLEGRISQWDKDVAVLSKENRDLVKNSCENRLALKHNPPLLLWDRREVEPLKLRADEFYPKKEMCLLDIHPRSIWPMLRENFPNNYDILEYVLGSFFTISSQSVKHGLMGLVPGAYEWISTECKTLRDPNKGGNPDLDKLSVRMLTDEMLQDILEAWIRWPWKPSRYEMLSRMGSSVHDPDSMEAEETTSFTGGVSG